jgi:nicotinamidase-related amidase
MKALILIDVQQGFDEPVWGERNNPAAEANLLRVLATWRARGWPVIHVQHTSVEPNSPLRPDRPVVAFKPGFGPQPGEPVFQKTVNSAFIGTGLEAHLRERQLTQLVIGGLTTDHCVSTSVRMAANLGFTATVLADGTATFSRVGFDGRPYTADEIHQVALVSLHGEFATVQTVDGVCHAD